MSFVIKEIKFYEKNDKNKIKDTKVNTKNQKFQIGDICKIVRADKNKFCSPIKNEETTGFGLYIMIVGSYGQIFPNLNSYNLSDYEVFVPKHLNNNIYSIEKDRYKCKIPNGMICSSGKSFEFGWSWVTDCQLDFIRKPNKEDLEALYDYGLTLKWGEYKKENPSINIWDSWEQMANQYLK